MHSSGILALPWDLRHAIWSLIVPKAVHVFYRGEQLAVSACSPSQTRNPDLYDPHLHYGTPLGRDLANQLESRWAQHWPCEEQQGNGLGRDVEALIMTSKPIFHDIIHFLMKAQIYVSCLDTLEKFVLPNSQQEDEPWRNDQPASLRLPRLTEVLRKPQKLFIILKVPPAFYLAMGDAETTENPSLNGTEETEQDQYQQHFLNSWRRIRRTLSELTGLVRLDIWIDIISGQNWSAFNEKAIIKPILPFAFERRDELYTTVYLPYVDPKWEREDWHFTELAAIEGLQIQRFARQRNFVASRQPDDAGYPMLPGPTIGGIDDFPCLVKHAEYWKFSTIEELADAERRLFRQGVNVQAGHAHFEHLLLEHGMVSCIPSAPRPHEFAGSRIWIRFTKEHSRFWEELEDLYNFHGSGMNE